MSIVSTAADATINTHRCCNTFVAVVLCTTNSTHCIQHLLAAAFSPRVCETGISAIDTLILLAEYIDLTGIRAVPTRSSENDNEAQSYTSGML
jgi:hypothetical protein